MSKKIMMIIGVALVILVALLLIIFQADKSSQPPKIEPSSGQANHFQVEFMSAEEQASLNISPDAKVQVINRTADGSARVYKIIKNEGDIVRDPAAVGPVSPRQVLPEIK